MSTAKAEPYKRDDFEYLLDAVEHEDPCRECRGRGYRGHDPDDPCRRCYGEGVEPVN